LAIVPLLGSCCAAFAQETLEAELVSRHHPSGVILSQPPAACRVASGVENRDRRENGPSQSLIPLGQ
jgi:hypothetical protein